MQESKKSKLPLILSVVALILAVVGLFTPISKIGEVVGSTSRITTLNVTGASTFGGAITHSTGNITSDTNTLFVDVSNNRVGVLDASPSTTFVVGTGEGLTFNSGTNATVLAGTLTSGAITSTGNSQVAELNVTGASTAAGVLCAKANGGIGQCSDNAAAWTAGNCTCG